MSPTGILSYRFTGEIMEELSPMLAAIQAKLQEIGFSEIFCSLFLEDFFNEQRFSIDERYQYCLDAQKNKDFFIGFIKSEHQSTGMKMELDKALENKQTILLLIKEGIEEHHPEFIQYAHYTIKFKTVEGLLNTLHTMDTQTMISAHHSD